MHSRLLITLLSALLMLSGCAAPPKLVANHDPGYKNHLTSILIFESGSLQDQYPLTKTNMDRIVTKFSQEIENQGVKTVKLNTKNQNPNEEIRSTIQRTDVKQILRIKIDTINTTTINYVSSVSGYDINFVIIDIQTGREVWKAVLTAQSSTDLGEIVKKLISQLKQDDLL